MCRKRMAKGRLFSDSKAIGEDLKLRNIAEHQWRRQLDERDVLDTVATRAEAEEETRIGVKVTVKWRAGEGVASFSFTTVNHLEA